jgi:hypothetical protein
LLFVITNSNDLVDVLHYKVISLWPRNARVLVTPEAPDDLLVTTVAHQVEVEVEAAAVDDDVPVAAVITVPTVVAAEEAVAATTETAATTRKTTTSTSTNRN